MKYLNFRFLPVLSILTAVALSGFFIDAATAQADSIGANNGTTFTNDTSVGTQSWTINGSSLPASFDSPGTPSPEASNYLEGTGFGFSVPEDATITGIEIDVERSANSTSVKDSGVYLMNGGSVTGTDHSDDASSGYTSCLSPVTGSNCWSESDTSVTYGNSTDLWGATWTPDEINDSSFGAAFAATRTYGTGDRTVNVANMTITVYYSTPPATLTIVKNTDPNSGDGTFNFEVDGTNDGNDFSASPMIATTSDTGSTTVSIPVGTYDITEDVLAGWNLIDADCVNQDGRLNNPIDNGESISVASGDQVTCTFTDSMRDGIVIYKTVTNDNGGTKNASDFSFNVTDNNSGDVIDTENFAEYDNDPTQGKSIVFVDSGNYSVSEPDTDEYTASYSNGDGGDCSDIYFDGNTSSECDISNDDQPASLTIVKNSDDAAGTFNFEINGVDGTNFTGTDMLETTTEGNFTATSEPTTLNAGTYDVTETGQDGWYLSGGTCVDSSDKPIGASIGNGYEIIANNGDDITCTFNNTQREGSNGTLIVKKVVVGGSDTAADFSFMVNGGDPIQFNANGENDLLESTSGTYTVTEPTFNGYTTSYDNCSNISIPENGSATCTITNTTTLGEGGSNTGGGGGYGIGTPITPETPPTTPSSTLPTSVELMVVPATENLTVGDPFIGAVGVIPAGNQVCSVQGTLVLSNLTCNLITLASGLTATVMPTCNNPTFAVTIPGCTTSNTVLFALEPTPSISGTASMTLQNEQVMGQTSVLPFTDSNGVYTVADIQPYVPSNPVTPPAIEGSSPPPPTPTPTLSQTTTPAASDLLNGNGMASVSGADGWRNFSDWIKANLWWLLLLLIVLLILLWIFTRDDEDEKPNNPTN